MANKSSMFVPVGKHIFDLNSITNISYLPDKNSVYVINNPNGFLLTDEEYQQLINYYFPNEYENKKNNNNNIHNDILPKYVIVGKNMFNTTVITHVLHDKNKNAVSVFINNNLNAMQITQEDYQLLIKYLLASYENNIFIKLSYCCLS